MNDTSEIVRRGPSSWKPDLSAERLRRRYRAERRFRFYGVAALTTAAGVLACLLVSISARGISGFSQTWINLEVYFDPQTIDPDDEGTTAVLADANYDLVARSALYRRFPDVTSRTDKRLLGGILSSDSGFVLREMVLADPALVGKRAVVRFLASDDADGFYKGFVDRNLPESERRLGNLEVSWLDALAEDGVVETGLSSAFFVSGDSREPELAGIRGAIVGSALTLFVTLALAFPLGVMAAVYLEEFAGRNVWTDLLEVNINNLAAVPSVIFGLLGLAMFLNVLGVPRSAPLAGGMVLAIMTLPTIIIAARAAMAAVPPSIREAALGVGASDVQVVFHHVLPLAMPGILTGTIIGMARALGETAPLLMIGMVAFIVDVPGSITDPATVLPVQIYLWADSPERAFVAKTAAAIMVLLGFLITMNGAAVVLRRRFERRW